VLVVADKVIIKSEQRSEDFDETPCLVCGLVAWVSVCGRSLPVGTAGGGAEAPKQAAQEKKVSKDEPRPASASQDEVKPAPSPTDPLLVPAEAKYHGSAAYQWLNIALEATAREHERHGARPTIGSRMLAIIVTAMYDAWAAYDDKAVGTRLGDKLRRPPAERTLANKEKAIACATCRAMRYVFQEDEPWILEQMRQHGLDPNDASTDLSTPQGVGNTAAAAVIAFRRHDGSNQEGDEAGSGGAPYSDYTYYRPVNPPNKILDPDRWQPIPFDDGKGGKITLGFLTPQWYRVKPFGLEHSNQYRPAPPPKVGDEKLLKEVNEVIAFNSSLTPQQKAIVEFMRDGPRSTGQSGHWLRFAQALSRRDKNGIDQDVKLFFAVGNTAFDAFIGCWEAKRYYDSSRPWTLVRYYYAGKQVSGWAGPGKGVVMLPAEDWHPYSPFTFITPPFPGFPSGHSTVSGACAKMLELFTGSDYFGDTEKRRAGLLTEPGFECNVIQMRHGLLPADGKMTCDVALKLPTFTAVAEMAGISRVMGGYHIQTDNIEGLKLGRKVAADLWPKLKAYYDGTAIQ
jgi:hypothetical protein